jgi:DNA replication protein DnaC
MSRALETHPGLDPSCAACGRTGMAVARRGERAIAEPCACIQRKPCPACGGAGWKPVIGPDGRRRGLEPCQCVGFAQRLARFNAMGIPGRMADRTFDNYVISDMEHQRDAYAAARTFALRYDPFEVSRGLVLWGSVGRGKTHLLVAILRQIAAQRALTARFIEFSHLLSTLKGRFDRGEGAAAVLDELVAVDLLAIDEIGKGMLTEFELSTIDELVSRRYNAARTIVATTNYRPGDPTGNARPNLADPRAANLPTLSDRVGERVFSRLSEMCDFAFLGGRDHRRGESSR